MFSKIIIFFVLSFSLTYAAENLKKHFQKTFFSHYEEGECGANIVNFLDRAEKLKINLQGSNVIEIYEEFGGASVANLINAEYARAEGPINPKYPTSGLKYFPGETNWSHHVILEKDGYIYDFDFGNKPQILKIKPYFEKMFLKDKTIKQGGEIYIGRDNKLKYYILKITSGPETLWAERDGRPYPKEKELRLDKYLKSLK